MEPKDAMEQGHDVICVGGGVIGLLTAYRLAEKHASVAVIDKGAVGREASWAGAGIIPPARLDTAKTPYDRLRAESTAAFPALAEELKAATEIDIGFRQTGGIEWALTGEDQEELEAYQHLWTAQKTDFTPIAPNEIQSREPNMRPIGQGGFWFPEMAQVRNPRFLRALRQACQLRGVRLLPFREVASWHRIGDRITGVHLRDGGTMFCDTAVAAAGAWSYSVLEELGVDIPVFPVKGQILAVKTTPDAVKHIVLVGKRYLVPRGDGIVLIGSTEENAGFDKTVTESAMAMLGDFARQFFPILADAEIVAEWAGLRPASSLNSPIITRAPDLDNLWIATGHFREGLQLSTGTSRLLADWISGGRSFASPEDFSVAADRTAYKSPFRS